MSDPLAAGRAARATPASAGACRRRTATPPTTSSTPGDLHQQRAEVAVLAEPEVLVERPLDAPEHHGGADDRAGGIPRAGRPSGQRSRRRSIKMRTRKTQKSSAAWKIGTGQPPAGLAGVVHAEPLVGRVPAAGHHQLRPEQPAHGPRGQEHGGDDVQGPTDGQLGTAAVGEQDAGGHGEEKSPERGEPAVPDGQHLARVVGVVAQVGEHVQRPGPDHGGEDDPQEHADEPVGAVAVRLAAAARSR